MVPRTESIWTATHPIREFPALSGSLDVDVAIIGGGITGLTAAVLLARAGRSVVLVEGDRVGGGETGHTTAHLTEAVDGRYQAIAKDFGEDAARRVARSSRDAIARIEGFVRELRMDAAFERLPGYLYTERSDDIDWLAAELDAASRAGCQVRWDDHVPLPFAVAGGICWENQAQVHATAYLSGLADEASARGVRIFEQTRATNVHDGEPCIVHTDRADIRARAVFVAANVPINNRVLLHTKVTAYRSYAVAATAPSRVVNGMFWDTENPYHYIRTQAAAGQWYLIVGGEDHRTGVETETARHHAALGAYTRDRFGHATVEFRWSGQIIEPVDGLPFIGRNSGSNHVFVATGYSGNGMTFGTLAGMVVSDQILGRPNPYTALYDATRIKPLAAGYEYVKENALFPARLVADRLTSHDADERSVESLKAGEGGVFDSDEGKLAICRDRSGALHAVSAVCTHLGCDVAWNQAEQSWDCPCHGSRFTPDGTVINGPAVVGLEARTLQRSNR